MQYVLGNMLNGAGGLNADGLALDLQFAADKTLTARKGPTPVFTRGSTGTFVGSNGLVQSAAVNAPRFDHDPVTLASRGLLIEESRTNICLQSENFGTTWTNDTGLVAISLDQTTSPSGAMDADKISENTTASNRRIAIQAQSFVSGTTYTFSCFVKAAERNFVQLRFGTAFGGQFQNFVIGGVNAGTIGSGVGATAAIQAYPNGWYRCSITATSATTGSSQVTIGPQISSTALAWNPYVGTIGSGIFVWGAQNEVGSFATSYIPTTTGSVVRSADVCSITGANFTSFYNNDQGTMVTVASANGFTSTNNAIAGIESGTTIVMRVFHRAAQTNRLSSQISATTLTPAASYNSANVIYKSAITAGATGADYVIDGTQIPDTYTGSVLTADNLKFTGMSGSASNTTISSFRYYSKRLPVSKLQALTA
jgi:hypothetical protein